MRALGLLVGLVLCGMTSPVQAARTYEGQEASALRCANMMATTGITLHASDLMTATERDVLLSISILMLERHVSGTWAEKKRALAVVRDRRDLEETLMDYQRNAPICLKRFPIN
ncbi:hypothetical protein [Sulfitobacter sp. S190]|uniref:hypothetical protein n=1 Tax=Sulfitobacter sp. S190 TaxID=2867022 RepID=UPI0021A27F18|nr:hypothetical protein [Sulfitobacter sp. S190]UWR23590.1 hypothetical protein K3756_06355 [Sulfitobacter sp. S190]